MRPSTTRKATFAVAALLPLLAGCRRDAPAGAADPGSSALAPGVSSTAPGAALAGRPAPVASALAAASAAPSAQGPAAPIPAGCEAAAASVAESLPDVKRVVASARAAADRSHGRQRFGGVGPLEDDDGGFSVGLGTHTDERFEAEVWYSVSRAGRLAVTVLGEDKAIPDDARRRVEKACAR